MGSDGAPSDGVDLAGLANSLDRRRFLGLAGAASVAAALPGRALAQDTQAAVTWAKPPVNFVYINAQDPNSLDPAVTTQFNAYDVIRNVYDALVWVDEANQKLVPWLAESFETSKDGRTHVFHIRKGVRFHDGSLLDARAVQLNIQRYTALKGGNQYLIAGLGRVTVVGPMTVKMTTQKADAWFPARLAKFPILSAKAIQQHKSASDPWAKVFFNTNMVGTGAYIFSGWQPGVQVTLKKNKNWWRGGWKAGSIDQVIVKPVVESATRVQLILSGQADFATQWTVADALSVGARSAFDLNKYRTTTTSPIIYMNSQKPPFDNRLVRQAFVAAFDYAAMARYYRGLSSPTGGPFPPFYPGADKSLANFKRDPNLARSLFRQAGVDPRSISFTFMPPAEFPDLVAGSAVAQSSFEELGVKVNVQKLPFSQVLAAYSKRETAGSMTAINNSPYTLDPSVFLAAFLPNFARFNLYNLQMPNVIKLIGQIQGETDPKKQQVLLNSVQKAIRAHAPAIFAATPQTLIPVRKYIHGYTMQHTDFRYPTLFYNLRIAAH